MADKPPREVDDNLLWREGRATKRISETENWREREWCRFDELSDHLAELFDVNDVIVVTREPGELFGFVAVSPRLPGLYGARPEEADGTALGTLAILLRNMRSAQRALKQG